MAHGRLHALPKQQPAIRQPMRPMLWPRARDGAMKDEVIGEVFDGAAALVEKLLGLCR